MIIAGHKLSTRIHGRIFAVNGLSPFLLCVSHRSWWGGGVSYSSFPPPPATVALHPNLSLKNPSLTAVGRFARRFVGNSATGHEVTDFKKL
jgi:hypothetical protein